jgi:5,10-methylenetetrahydrofolate reductase
MLKNERLCNKLKTKKFVITVEISPPKGIDVTKVIEEARKLKGVVDAINITDSPMANMRMSPIALAHILQDHLNIEAIFHLTCRDRNLIGLQSELLGAHALGVRNILALTGDSPKLGDTPYAKGVYDVDSVGLLRIIKALNSGFDYSGNKIDSPTSFCAGTTANPNDLSDEAIEKLYKKIEAGAEFIQTQPVYDKEILFKFLDKIKEVKVPILVGILPLKSYKMALRLMEKVPGIEISAPLLEKLEKGGKDEGLRLAVEFVEEIKDKVGGIHVMPMGSVDFVFEILSRLEKTAVREKEVEPR